VRTPPFPGRKQVPTRFRLARAAPRRCPCSFRAIFVGARVVDRLGQNFLPLPVSRATVQFDVSATWFELPRPPNKKRGESAVRRCGGLKLGTACFRIGCPARGVFQEGSDSAMAAQQAFRAFRFRADGMREQLAGPAMTRAISIRPVRVVSEGPRTQIGAITRAAQSEGGDAQMASGEALSRGYIRPRRQVFRGKILGRHSWMTSVFRRRDVWR